MYSLRTTPLCWGPIALGYLVPTFGFHRVLSSKMTLTMPSRRFSQRLHPDEDLPQTSTQNHAPTQILSTIAEGPENPSFSDIPEVQLHQPANNMSTIAVGSSQNNGGTSSTQTNGRAHTNRPSEHLADTSHPGQCPS
jgi:hypothetical protein